jgi:hypothetical protein
MPMSEKNINTDSELSNVLSDISFRRSIIDFKWKFEFSNVSIGQRSGWLLWAQFERPDVETGKIGIGRGRDEIIYQGSTESSVVKTAWLVVELLVRHELMEAFQYKEKVIFNPHHSVEELSVAAHLFNAR